MDITSEQVRAARALLRWEQKDLAARSGISLPAIKKMETIRGPLRAQKRTAEAIQKAFATHGVKFTDGGEPGVKLVRRSAFGVQPPTFSPSAPSKSEPTPRKLTPADFPVRPLGYGAASDPEPTPAPSTKVTSSRPPALKEPSPAFLRAQALSRAKAKARKRK